MNNTVKTTAANFTGFIVFPHHKDQLMLSLVKQALNRTSGTKLFKYLSAMGENAHRRRRIDVLEIIANLLIGFNQPEGYLFRGLYFYQKKKYDEAKTIFENLLPAVTGRTKARVALALGATLYDSKIDSSLPVYLQAIQAGADGWCDPQAVVIANRMVAINKSLAGDQRAALRDLENLYPLARSISSINPFEFGHYLNSLAVEYGDANRLDAAERICRFLLALPYANTYPEWSETWADLSEKKTHNTRSQVVIVSPLTRGNLIQMPVADPSPSAGEMVNGEPAKVLNFQVRRAEMAKQNEPKEKQLEKESSITKRDKRTKIINELLEFDHPELDAMMDFIEKLRNSSKDASES